MFKLTFDSNSCTFFISQLFYDGQPAMAKSVASMAQINDMCPPSDKLYNIVKSAKTDGG